jgi:hypothetical protein
MFKRTADVSCSLKESIDGLEIIVCGNKNKIIKLKLQFSKDTM